MTENLTYVNLQGVKEIAIGDHRHEIPESGILDCEDCVSHFVANGYGLEAPIVEMTIQTGPISPTTGYPTHETQRQKNARVKPTPLAEIPQVEEGAPVDGVPADSDVLPEVPAGDEAVVE